MPTTIGELGCDPDQANGDFGDFFLTSTQLVASATGSPLTVMARNGLRLRAGPGTDFDVLRIVPFGTQVHPMKTSGDWTMVSLSGDNASDGFMNTHFLSS